MLWEGFYHKKASASPLTPTKGLCPLDPARAPEVTSPPLTVYPGAAPVQYRFWITLVLSTEHKYHIFNQYWHSRNVPVFTNTRTFQYLGPKVYLFQGNKQISSIQMTFNNLLWFISPYNRWMGEASRIHFTKSLFKKKKINSDHR